jgi:hypothetical protein
MRRFPSPWDIEEANASCFIVKDNNGRALAYVYFEQEPGRRTAANLLTREKRTRVNPASRCCSSLRRSDPAQCGRAAGPLIEINLRIANSCI